MKDELHTRNRLRFRNRNHIPSIVYHVSFHSPYVTDIHFPKNIAGKSRSRIMTDQKTPQTA